MPAAMRLSPAQTDVILACVRQQYGADATVMLFGSRLDDSAPGRAFARSVRGKAQPLGALA